jgi:hypothetical protein
MTTKAWESLIRFDRGHAQIGPALKRPDPSDESAYYSATMDCRDQRLAYGEAR